MIEIIADNNAIPNSLSLNYSVVEGFDQPLGKFANTLGNVAIVDCHSVGIKLKSFITNLIAQLQTISPLTRTLINQLLPNIDGLVSS